MSAQAEDLRVYADLIRDLARLTERGQVAHAETAAPAGCDGVVLPPSRSLVKDSAPRSVSRAYPEAT